MLCDWRPQTVRCVDSAAGLRRGCSLPTRARASPTSLRGRYCCLGMACVAATGAPEGSPLEQADRRLAFVWCLASVFVYNDACEYGLCLSVVRGRLQGVGSLTRSE